MLVNAACELKLQHDTVWARVLNAESAGEHAALECLLLPQTVSTMTIGLTCVRVKGLLFESGAGLIILTALLGVFHSVST